MEDDKTAMGGQVNILEVDDASHANDSQTTDLAHVPESRRPLGARLKDFGATLKSKDAWFGDYVSSNLI